MTAGQRRACPICDALLIPPALFCDADWLAIPHKLQQEIGERYCEARIAQGARSSDECRRTERALREALERASGLVRALLD